MHWHNRPEMESQAMELKVASMIAEPKPLTNVRTGWSRLTKERDHLKNFVKLQLLLYNAHSLLVYVEI